MPGTVLGAEYTTDSEQGKSTMALWGFQASGEDKELQKHRRKATTQIWDSI